MNKKHILRSVRFFAMNIVTDQQGLDLKESKARKITRSGHIRIHRVFRQRSDFDRPFVRFVQQNCGSR